MNHAGTPRRRVALFALSLAAAGLALAACGRTPQSALDPAGPVARMQLQLIGLSFWVMTAIFAVVAFFIVASVIRFRARPDDDRPPPPQVEGNFRLELTWTLIPILLLVILAVPTVKDAYAVAAPPPGSDPLLVRVVGHQWWWEFDYQKLGLVTADELHIPAGRPVTLALQSADVIHSFWVPRLAGKTDLIPGRTNTLWLEASRPGTYLGQCAQYCGTSHALMRLRVIADSPTAFTAWTQRMLHPRVKPTGAAATAGYADFGQVGCSGCHAIAGTSFQGNIGPNLTGLALRTTIAAGNLANNDANLARWLADPPAFMPGVDMPDLHLSPTQIHDLIAYLDQLT